MSSLPERRAKSDKRRSDTSQSSILQYDSQPLGDLPTMKARPRSLRRLERRPLLSQSVQDEIKSYLVENNLRPGDPLPSEADFAQQLGVSRNSVREAAKSLQTLGYIEARVGSGLFVGKFSIDTMLDLLPFDMAVDASDFAQAFSAREYLELGTANDLLAAVDDELLEDLDGILADWLIQTNAGEYLPELDLAFHRALAVPLHNRVVLRLVELLWEVRNRARESGVIPPPRDLATTLARHQVITEALRRRDVEAYRAAIIEHYAGSRRESLEDSVHESPANALAIGTGS